MNQLDQLFTSPDMSIPVVLPELPYRTALRVITDHIQFLGLPFVYHNDTVILLYYGRLYHTSFH